MKIDPRIAAIAVAILVIGGIAVAKARGSDDGAPSPSSATGAPGAAAVESDNSAENRPTQPGTSASGTPSSTATPADTEDEGNENSDTIGSDNNRSDSDSGSDGGSDSDGD